MAKPWDVGAGRLNPEGSTPTGHIMDAQPKALISKVPFQGGPMETSNSLSWLSCSNNEHLLYLTSTNPLRLCQGHAHFH